MSQNIANPDDVPAEILDLHMIDAGIYQRTAWTWTAGGRAAADRAVTLRAIATQAEGYARSILQNAADALEARAGVKHAA